MCQGSPGLLVEAYGNVVENLREAAATRPTFETATVASDCHDAARVFMAARWKLKQSATGDALTLMEEQLVNVGVRLAAMLNATI